MTTILTVLSFVVLTQAFIFLLVENPDRRWVAKVTLFAWFLLFPLLSLVNDWFPFSGGGDDSDYFIVAATQFNSLKDYFDLNHFVGSMEQPGYPWLLAILYQFVGHELLAFKLVNLTFYILLIPILYRIGMEIENGTLGRAMALGVLVMTPLWFYWMFLLKDITITFLQSLFLLGVVQISKKTRIFSWLLILFSTLALIPFRSPLILINVAIIAGSLMLIFMRHGKQNTILKILPVSLIVIGAVLSVASNPDLLSKIGIYTEHRVIGSDSAMKTLTNIHEESLMNRALFPLLYLLSEISALNPKSWVDFTPLTLRGVLALPWIFVGVPLFLFGCLWLTGYDHQTMPRGGLIARFKSMRFVATPWGCVLVFILIYVIASWSVGDTTRWRIPDMPAMSAVAVAGWMSLSPKMRMRILASWWILAGILFSLFYLIREL